MVILVNYILFLFLKSVNVILIAMVSIYKVE